MPSHLRLAGHLGPTGEPCPGAAGATTASAHVVALPAAGDDVLVCTPAGGPCWLGERAGSLAAANRLAPAETRGQVISTYFVFAYVGLTVPVIAVGFGAQAFGNFRATLACAVALAVIAVASMATIRRTAA